MLAMFFCLFLISLMVLKTRGKQDPEGGENDPANETSNTSPAPPPQGGDAGSSSTTGGTDAGAEGSGGKKRTRENEDEAPPALQQQQAPPPPPVPPAAPAPQDPAHPFRCSECGRGFASSRALFGHMKSHPRNWRGAYPPPTFSREEFRDLPGVNLGDAPPVAAAPPAPPPPEAPPAQASGSRVRVPIRLRKIDPSKDVDELFDLNRTPSPGSDHQEGDAD